MGIKSSCDCLCLEARVGACLWMIKPSTAASGRPGTPSSQPIGLIGEVRPWRREGLFARAMKGERDGAAGGERAKDGGEMRGARGLRRG